MAYAPKAVVHLRAQYRRKRLGLIFGAGLSRGLGFPDWADLVKSLALAADVDAKQMFEKFVPNPPNQPVLPRSLASITHMLFGRFRARAIAAQLATGAWKEPVTFLDEQQIRSQWLRLIHATLYANHDPTACEANLKAHRYLEPYREIIRASPVTVNYNFDNSLEKLLYYNRPQEEERGRAGTKPRSVQTRSSSATSA